MVSIREVKSRADVKEFVTFPLRLYRNCAFFAPPLYADEKKLVASGGKREIAESVFYLASRDGKTVGRIQGILQKQYNELHACRQVRFTRFDCIDDGEVASKLLSVVEEWGKEKGMNEVLGPLGYNDLEREGLLVEGFEENATFEEQYNFPYYAPLIEASGYRKDADWLEFELRMPEKRNPMLHRVAERSLELNKLHVASSDMPKKQYIEKYRDGFFDCLDECYSKLYGTVPISKEAQDELIEQFMLIVNKECAIFICDEKENVVGFGLCFPSIADAVKKSGGRLTLPTLVKIWRAVKHPKIIDLGLVAIRPAYQSAGVNAIILDSMLDMLASGKVEKCETNLNLETNEAVMAQWKYFSARQHKRRRSYIKTIEGDKNNA